MNTVNTNIPLSVQSIDTASPLIRLSQQMRQKKQDNIAQETHDTNQKIRQEQLQQERYQSLDTRNQSRLNSVILGAAELDTYLKTGNVDGAKNFLLNRRADLGQRIANGESVDTAETDEALALLESDPEMLRTQTSQAIELGRNLGIFKTQTNTGGATGNLVDRLMAENPNMSFGDALAQVQTGFRNGIKFKDGDVSPIEGFADAKRGIKKSEQDGKNESDLEKLPEIERATKRARYIEEGFQKLPKIQRTLASKELTDEFLTEKIDSIAARATKMNTGFAGGVFNAVSGTDAFDLKADLQTLLANAGFDRLQEMRDNSPTGGALGAINESEMELLKASWQNLIQSQSKEQFLRNLESFKEQRSRTISLIRQAY